ncbi:hypothetical protein NVP2275O_114 [Vibrio phage 2.275.O._10N.286.54.E11]|nr:hypothetical protein NVP2275O_114 [Vibrio phage 2.275.O._10N.286.54.E11]
MQATMNIDLKIRSNAGRTSITIPKGAVVNVETRGPYIHIIYNDNNFRLDASYLQQMTIHKECN